MGKCTLGNPASTVFHSLNSVSNSWLSLRWLYSRILAEDANFKQKAKLRSSDEKDPVLGPGWATFVNNQAYMEHLLNVAHQDEVACFPCDDHVRLCLIIAHRSATVLGFLRSGTLTRNVPED